MADVFQQLEAHLQIALLVDARQYAGRQFGHNFLRRQAGNRIRQPTNCGCTFLVSTQLTERKLFAKKLQGESMFIG